MLTAIIYEKLPKIKSPKSRKEEKHLYYLKYKEIIKQKCHDYYLLHREEILKRNREWNKLHGKERINCDICNLEINRGSFYRHKKIHKKD